MNIDPACLRVFAERYTEAWCSQSPERVAACYSPNGSLRVNDAEPAVGRSTITVVAKGFMEAFPDMRVSMDNLIVEGDRVIYRWTHTGTNTGPGGTGKRVCISGCEEWEMGADGLIARSLGSFDAAEYQRQLEHGPEPSGR